MEHQLKQCGQSLDAPQFHLKRIGPRATKIGVADIMDFTKTTTLIGRNKSQVDYLLDSSNPVASQYISRLHARVILQANHRCRLFNDSLNGIFINNIKMCGSVILQEGDIVTFGHPYGAQLSTGVWKRQPDSEYQFLFERCACQPLPKMRKTQILEDKINISMVQHGSKPVYNDSIGDKESVLNASKILDSCINKITGLAGSLMHRSRQGDVNSSNSCLNLSDNQRRDQIPESNNKEKDEQQKRITDFFGMGHSGNRSLHSGLDDTIVASSPSVPHKLHYSGRGLTKSNSDSTDMDRENVSSEAYKDNTKIKSNINLQDQGRNVSSPRKANTEAQRSVKSNIGWTGFNIQAVAENQTKQIIQIDENICEKESVNKSIHHDRSVAEESVEEQRVKSKEHVTDSSFKENIGSNHQVVFLSPEMQSEALNCLSIKDKTASAKTMICDTGQRIGKVNEANEDVSVVSLDEGDIIIEQMSDASQDMAAVNKAVPELKQDMCTEKCISETLPIQTKKELPTHTGAVLSTEKDGSLSGSPVIEEKQMTVGAVLKDQVAGLPESHVPTAVEQIPCSVSEARNTLIQTPVSTNQVLSVTKIAAITNPQIHHVSSEILATTYKQMHGITEKAINSHNEMPRETARVGSSNGLMAGALKKMSIFIENQSGVKGELADGNVNMAAVMHLTNKHESNGKEALSNEVIPTHVTQESYTAVANQLVNGVSGETCLIPSQMLDEAREKSSTEHAGGPSKAAVTTVPEINENYNEQSANMLMEQNADVSGVVGNADVHMQLGNENVVSDHTESTAQSGMKDTFIQSNYNVTDNAVGGNLVSIPALCVNLDQTDMSNTCGTLEENINSCPSQKIKDPQVSLSHSFYGLNYKGDCAPEQSTSPLQTRTRKESVVPEKRVGDLCAFNPKTENGIKPSHSYQNRKQKEEQIPLFSTATERKLHFLLKKVRRQKCEDAAKEHELFLKRWRQLVTSDVDGAKDDEKMNIFSETLDVVHSGYSLINKSVKQTTDYPHSEVQNNSSPTSARMELDIFNLETQNYLKRQICAAQVQERRDNEMEYLKFIEQHNELKISSRDHHTQHDEPFDIAETVRSNYSVVSALDLQYIKQKGQKDMLQGRARKNKVGDAHVLRMKHNELEYKTFIEQWRMSKENCQTQDVEPFDMTEIVRSNYRVVSPLNVQYIKEKRQRDMLQRRARKDKIRVVNIQNQRTRHSELEYQKFIEQWRIAKKNCQTQDNEPFDMSDIVRSNYRVVSPLDVQYIQQKGRKDMLQRRARMTKVGNAHVLRMKHNESEYKTFIEQWRMTKKNSYDYQDQEEKMSEVVRSNYNIAAPIEMIQKNKTSIPEQETLTLPSILPNSYTDAMENFNKTVNNIGTFTVTHASNADQTISFEGEDELFSNNPHSPDSKFNNTQITSAGLNDADIEKETIILSVDSANMSTQVEPGCFDLHAEKNLTDAQVHSDRPSPSGIAERDPSTDSEPIESQFTTSTPDVDNNVQLHHTQISVSPVLRVSINRTESNSTPKECGDITLVKDMRDEISGVDLHQKTLTESGNVEKLRLATEEGISKTFDETSSLCETEVSPNSLETLCSSTLNVSKNDGQNLSITENKQMLYSEKSMHSQKGLADFGDEKTMVVNKASNDRMEGDSHTCSENEQTLNTVSGLVECQNMPDNASNCETMAHANLLSTNNIYSGNNMELNQTVVGCMLERDIEGPSSPELFSQASTVTVSTSLDVKYVTASGIDLRANYDQVMSQKESNNSVNFGSPVSLEEQLSKCGLTTTVSIISCSMDSLASNKAVDSDIVDNTHGTDKQTQRESGNDSNRYECGATVEVDLSIDNLSKDDVPNCQHPQPVHFSSPKFSAFNTSVITGQVPAKMDSSSPDTLGYVGASHGSDAPHCSLSPTDTCALSLSQMSELKDEDEMHLVWSQADVSANQSSTSSAEHENTFYGDFEYFSKPKELLENMDLSNKDTLEAEKNSSTKMGYENIMTKGSSRVEKLSGSSVDENSSVEVVNSSLSTEILFQETPNLASFLEAGSLGEAVPEHIVAGERLVEHPRIDGIGETSEAAAAVQNDFGNDPEKAGGAEVNFGLSSGVNNKGTNKVSHKVAAQNNVEIDFDQVDVGDNSDIIDTSNQVDVESNLEGTFVVAGVSLEVPHEIDMDKNNAETSDVTKKVGETSDKVAAAENIFDEADVEELNPEVPSDEVDAAKFEDEISEIPANQMEETSYETAAAGNNSDIEKIYLGTSSEQTSDVAKNKMEETCNTYAVAQNNVELTSDKVDVVENNEKVSDGSDVTNKSIKTSDKTDGREVSKCTHTQVEKRDLDESKNSCMKDILSDDAKPAVNSAEVTDSTNVCNSGLHSFTGNNYLSSEKYARKKPNDSCIYGLVSANSDAPSYVTLSSSPDKNWTGDQITLLTKGITGKKTVEDGHFEQEENISLKRKCFDIPVSLSVKKKRTECQIGNSLSTDRSSNSSLLMSETYVSKQRANYLVLLPTQSPLVCKSGPGPEMSITSLSPVRSNCDAPKSQVGTRKQTVPKRSEEFAAFNTKKYEEKRLSSQPSESENLADDTKILIEDRQIPVLPNKKTVFHSNDGQLGEVSCVAESGTEKVIHPKFLPTSTSTRHDLKRSLSADRSLEHSESRQTKILHFLPPNTCVGNQSSTGDKDFTAKPNLPTLSPPSPTLSSSSHQMPHFSEHVPGSFQNKHKEGEYTHHPHTRRKNLQEAVLSELERLTKEIRSSLRVNSPNMQQAIEALHDLDQLPITPELVMKVPAVLDTVKKCQRYEGSAEVRQLSHTIFTRYKALILHMQTHKQ